MTKERLISELIEGGYLKTPRIVAAFEAVDRADFIPEELETRAYDDTALPLGYGSTISQPLTVALMLEELLPEAGDNILDVGSGSGWTSALLSHIVGEAGRVHAVEVVPELSDRSEETIREIYPELYERIQFYAENAEDGLPEAAPFQRILASAAVYSVSQTWMGQLAIGGRMVVPVRNSVYRIDRVSVTDFCPREFSGFAFVPFQKV